MKLCGAQTRTESRAPCKNRPVPGHWRCYKHGGRNRKGTHTPEGIARTEAVRKPAQLAWIKRTMALKAAGLIDKRPGGWPKGVPAKRENLMAKALAIVDTALHPPETGTDSTLARDLEDLTGKSVVVIRDVLTRKVAKKSYYRKIDGKSVRVDPDLKLLTLQTSTALEVVKAKIRVDETAFKAQRADHLLPIIEQLLAGESPREAADEDTATD